MEKIEPVSNVQPRDVRLIGEIRKHNRAIRDAYEYYHMDMYFGRLHKDVVDFLHECGTADNILLEKAEEIIND